MIHPDLVDALLNLDAREVAAPPDPRQVTLSLLQRDRRRVRLLAGLAVVLWLVAAGGLGLLVFALHDYIVWVRVRSFMPEQSFEAGADKGNPLRPGTRLTPSLDQTLRETNLIHHSTPVVAGAVGALVLAALCTVLLVFSSRRATLRQINASLLAICEQLRQLRPAAGSPPGKD
jgi:hypothetical protein